MPKSESVYQDVYAFSGLLRTRAGGELTYLIAANPEVVTTILLLDGELVAHLVRTEEGQQPVVEMLVMASFYDIHELLWPCEKITEQHALIIDALSDFVIADFGGGTREKRQHKGTLH